MKHQYLLINLHGFTAKNITIQETITTELSNPIHISTIQFLPLICTTMFHTKKEEEEEEITH
jgi:hypothetical protein